MGTDCQYQQFRNSFKKKAPHSYVQILALFEAFHFALTY